MTRAFLFPSFSPIRILSGEDGCRAPRGFGLGGLVGGPIFQFGYIWKSAKCFKNQRFKA